jgi:hypothetical protein
MFSAFFFGDKEDYLYFCTQSHLEVVYMRGVYHESGASRSFLACCVYSSNPFILFTTTNNCKCSLTLNSSKTIVNVTAQLEKTIKKQFDLLTPKSKQVN